MVVDSALTSKYLHGTVVVGIVCKDCIVLGVESVVSLTGLLFKEKNMANPEAGAIGLVAGYDSKPQLFDIDGSGAVEKVKYSASMSSGVFQATTILDENYHDNMTEQEGIELCVRAISEAKKRAPGVGGFSMDIVVINKNGAREISQKEINAILAKNKNYLLQRERDISK